MSAEKDASEKQWETRHDIRFPMPPSDAPRLSVEDIHAFIADVRDERSDRAAGHGPVTRS